MLAITILYQQRQFSNSDKDKKTRFFDAGKYFVTRLHEQSKVMSPSQRQRFSIRFAVASLANNNSADSADSNNTLLQVEILHPRLSVKKYQSGLIVRVKFTIFVTYTTFEFNPGPSLNMVIVPNGAGKSTHVRNMFRIGMGSSGESWQRQKILSISWLKFNILVGPWMFQSLLNMAFKSLSSQSNLWVTENVSKEKNLVIQCNVKQENNKNTLHLRGKFSNK